MEMNFYIWLVLTIAVTVYAWVGITRGAKKKEVTKVFLEN